METTKHSERSSEKMKIVREWERECKKKKMNERKKKRKERKKSKKKK
jgi:hypothetical protein